MRYCCLCMVVFYNLTCDTGTYQTVVCYQILSATETFASLTEAHGDATLSRSMVFEWHKVFKEGQENVEDDPDSGRPISSTSDQNVEVVQAVMVKDRRMSVRMIGGQTVNHAFYKDVLEQLRKRVQVQTDTADDWVLHHNNAPAITALSIREFLVKKNIPVLLHPPYSPNLAPCNLYLFSKLKSKLKGHHFRTKETYKKL